VNNPEVTKPPRSLWRKLIRAVALLALGIVVLGMTGWSVLAIYYSNLPVSLRPVLAGVFAVAVLCVFIFVRPSRRSLLVFAVMFAVLVALWFQIPASNDRDWKPEVAVLASATVNGDEVMIRNVRNFEYRTETDFTPRYYDKTYNLKDLESVDLICVYWGSEAIAHVMVSFGFAGKDYVTFSIETRPEEGESFSTLKGFFRQVELYYVVADERDVIGVRANYRNPREQVYIYRTRMPLENQRRLFLDYIRELNELAAKPKWYNTLTDNCTTGVLLHTKVNGGRVRYNWKVLLSGYTAEYAYEIGSLDNSMPFEELQKRCLVNDRVQGAGDADDFSRKIREGIPAPAPLTMEEFLQR
jgi:hypothetical protein